MNCNEAVPLLYDLIDGDLSAADRDLLDPHLMSCARCQAELASIRAAEQVFQREMRVVPEADLDARIVAEIWPAASRPARRIWPKLAAAAAAFVACAYLLGTQPQSVDYVQYLNEVVTIVEPQNLPDHLKESAGGFASLKLLLTQLWDSATVWRARLTATWPAVEGYWISILAIVALQVAISYRLLGDGAMKQDKNA